MAALIALFVLLLTAMHAHAEPAAVVLKPVLNMHSGPSDERDVVSQAIYGTNVGVLEEKDGWARVRTPDEYTGWVPVASLRRVNDENRAYATTGAVVQVATLFAHLYREPSVTRRAPLLTVPFETTLEMLAPASAEQPRWMQVRLADGRDAWLQAGDVMPATQRLSIPEMIALSRRFLGLPYTWGGTSAYGYDCSGFTQMLCRRRGVLMPRDAHDQAAWAGLAPVERSALQPGDLLYFGASPEQITHTGLYIGQGEFIHATTSGQPVVQVSRLDEGDWTRLHVASRRPREPRPPEPPSKEVQ